MVKTIIGENTKDAEVTVKAYSSGVKITETGDSVTVIKGQKPSSEMKVKISKEDREKLFDKPDKFEVSKNRLVRKDKKK